MKTPRELLLSKHEGATPALDAIREQVVNGIGAPTEPKLTSWSGQLREALWSLRWHLAPLGAAWLLVLGLQLTAGNIASDEPRIASAPTSEQLAIARENRRQLRDLIDSRVADGTVDPTADGALRPRSERTLTLEQINC